MSSSFGPSGPTTGTRRSLTIAMEIGEPASENSVTARLTPPSMTSKCSFCSPVTNRLFGSVTVTLIYRLAISCADTVGAPAARKREMVQLTMAAAEGHVIAPDCTSLRQKSRLKCSELLFGGVHAIAIP